MGKKQIFKFVPVAPFLFYAFFDRLCGSIAPPAAFLPSRDGEGLVTNKQKNSMPARHDIERAILEALRHTTTDLNMQPRMSDCYSVTKLNFAGGEHVATKNIL